MKYIDDKGADNIRHYTYKGVDHSLLALYVGQPYWSRVVTLLPLSLAPNMVTLIGFFAMVFQYFLITYYCPQFSGEAPPFVYLTVALCVFFYQTMDAIDGKQARRTKTSSPVGEIFDHGCDALSLILLGLSVFTVIQVGDNIELLIVAIGMALFSFYTTLWEEFHSHVMYLGYVNVTEAQVLIMSIDLLAFFKGPKWFLNTLDVGEFTVTYGDVAVGITIFGAIVTSIRNIFTVFKRYAKEPVKFLGTLTQLIPLFQILGGIAGWYFLFPDVLRRHTHSILIGYGTLHAALNGFLVVFRVACQPFPLFYYWALPTFAPFVFHFLSLSSPLWLDYYPVAFGFYGVIVYVYLAQKVLREVASVFKISIFTIPPEGYDFNKVKK